MHRTLIYEVYYSTDIPVLYLPSVLPVIGVENLVVRNIEDLDVSVH
jgi:hypothetical protein